MDPKETHTFDQNLAKLLDTLPSTLFSFYKRCVKEGFSDEQAMVFTVKWLELMFVMGNNLPSEE